MIVICFIVVVLIVYLIYKADANKQESLNILSNELDNQIDIYKKLYTDYSKMELLYLFNKDRELFRQRWNIVVEVYNSNNPDNKINFVQFDLENNEHLLEFDTQADFMIAKTYGTEFIAPFRAVCDRLLEIEEIDDDTMLNYNGKMTEYYEVPWEERVDSVMCTKTRLNALINNPNINKDIYNLFEKIKNCNLYEIITSLQLEEGIIIDYPGLATYCFNYIFQNYNAFSNDEDQIYDLLDEFINNHILLMLEIDGKSFHDAKVTKENKKRHLEFYKAIIEDYSNDDDLMYFIDSIYESNKKNTDYLKFLLNSSQRNFILNNFNSEELYKLCEKNRFEEADLILKNLSNYDKFNKDIISINKNNYKLITNEEYDLVYDNGPKKTYRVPAIELKVYDAVIKNPKINDKTKNIIKNYLKKQSKKIRK